MIYLFLKRMFDIIFGIIVLILLIPISILIKIITLLNKDFNSIFYVQVRIGKNGKKFNLYKFRTMIPNAEEELEELLKIKKYKNEWDKNQKLKNDPRITKIGKILRKTSIDELPQFINILKGDMSLIGPRPLVDGELQKHKGNPKIYHSIKPGITGWWVCNGRQEMTYKKRLNLEYYYIKNMGIWMDIKCIFKTIKIVLKGNI
ncbi:MAG: sugar transferase [Bacilli bacterium]|nr:sugar transferase [Bacilli bacterium]